MLGRTSSPFRWLLCSLYRWLVAAALITASAAAGAARTLPAQVRHALADAGVPQNSVAVVVQEVGARRAALLLHPDQPMNPASVFKLVTTSAALDLLGPAHTWTTPVWFDGPVRDGVLDGSLVIQGTGDPTLVLERVWLLLRRVQELGVREIHGDIVLDRSAFSPDLIAPGAFDGEPLKPYNVQPDALLLNFKSVLYTFTPEPAAGVAHVGVEPALAGLIVQRTVPLADGPCGDWHTQLASSVSDAELVGFAGSYPASCGERQWAVAYPAPERYNARLLAALWTETGGVLRGSVREGAALTAQAPTLMLRSPPLAQVVRDINKFSNNVMAQQLFLTLGAEQAASGTPEAARGVLQRWLVATLGDKAADTVIDNGAGLSRTQRISAATLAGLLQRMYASPEMSELMSSLPLAGEDGTLRRMQARTGCAHLKTGSLRDVAAVAGYVLGASGKRYVLVALINDPHAGAARDALDALVRWTCDDMPSRR